MSTAIIWMMAKDISPAPGDLLVRGTTLEICFILMDNVVIQLAWDGAAWIACWGHSGTDTHHTAVKETARHEQQGFALLGKVHTARSHLSPTGLYALATRGTAVQLKHLMPGEWLQIDEAL